MKRILHTVSWIILVTLAGFMFYGYYQQFAPVKIIDIHSPLKVKTPIVKEGEILVYVGDYCQYKVYPATVSRTLIGSTVVPLPIVNTIAKRGCHVIDIQIPIPSGTIPGTYNIEGVARYQVNPNRFIDVKFNSESFNIIK